jgi:biopolymer transport protein ExbD
MAFSGNGGNGGGLGSRKRYGGTLAEINITPFVDVVLVLLIIFMLTAHVMEFGIEVDVPKTKYVRDTAQEMPVVTITKDATITLNGKPVNYSDLAAAIHQRYGKAKGVYIRADKATPWDPIAQVMDALGAAKFQVNMVTQPEDTAAKGHK